MDDAPECPQRQLVAWSDGGPAPHARADFGLFVAALQAAGGFTGILGHLVSRISFLALCRFSHTLCVVSRTFSRTRALSFLAHALCRFLHILACEVGRKRKPL